jgi:HSP20 family protein
MITLSILGPRMITFGRRHAPHTLTPARRNAPRVDRGSRLLRARRRGTLSAALLTPAFRMAEDCEVWEDPVLERYDPFGRTMSLRQMMDRLMEDAFVMPRGGQAAGAGSAAMDVYEEGENLIVEAQLPGMKPDDIDISVERGTLTIRGETKAEEERKERNYLIREQRMGSFSRSLHLPESVDTDACQATFENGVLRLTFPKAERAKPRRIQVTPGGGAQAIGAGTSGSAGAGGGSSQTRAGGQSAAQSGAGEQPGSGAGRSSGGRGTARS